MRAALRRFLTTRPEHRLRWLVQLGFGRVSRTLDRACRDPEAAQLARLRAILVDNATTEIGRRYGFSSSWTINDHRQNMPIVGYDDVAADIERMVEGAPRVLTDEAPVFYATSSGTTGRRKLLPVTSAFVRECQVTNRVLYRTLFTTFPHLLGGQRLTMRSPGTQALPGSTARAGSITVALGGGVDDDDVTGPASLDAVPAAVFGIEDFATKYAVALRFALQGHITVLSAINPSTLLLFATTLEQRGSALLDGLADGGWGIHDDAVAAIAEPIRQRLQPLLAAMPTRAAALRERARAGGWRLRDVFPELRGAITWLGGHGPYFVAQLRKSIGDLPIVDYGYGASEGCFGAPLEANTAGSVLMPHGHVIELVPDEMMAEVRAGRATTVLLHEAELGARYQVVITASNGLYRYDMGDVVEVIGHHHRAPIVAFLHKAGTTSSMVGEKLTESQVMTALTSLQVGGGGAMLTAVMPAAGQGTPHYRLLIEGASLDDQAIDDQLRASNEEFDAKRSSLRLAPTTMMAVPRGSFARLRAARVAQGAADAHVKIPVLDRDGSWARQLLDPS
jgi:hypothetical protein